MLMFVIFLGVVWLVQVNSLIFEQVSTRLKSSLKLNSIRVGLTRQLGSNQRLSELLTHEVVGVEIPCIQFLEGEDFPKLKVDLQTHDIIIITSPQSAKLFVSAWKSAKRPFCNVAAIGSATASILLANDINVYFCPSVPTAAAIVSELPFHHPMSSTRPVNENFLKGNFYGVKVLYPTSNLADQTITRGLTSRGFNVTRLNTYRTAPADWDKAEYHNAKSIDIVALGSPSAAEVWRSRAGTRAVAVTIGATTERAARELGFSSVVSAADGLTASVDTWAAKINQVAKSLASRRPPAESSSSD